MPELQLPTESIGFFEANCDAVARGLEDWRRTHAWFRERPGGLASERVVGGLRDGLARLPPFGASRDRELLWDCGGSKWTAYFDNCGDAISAVRAFCAQSGLRGVVLTDAESMNPSGRDMQFVLHDGRDRHRSVQLTWEGRWEFSTYGELLPFEELERYERRLKRERLTSEMLERYCAHLSIYPYDAVFYGDRGFLLSDVRTEQQRRSFSH